MSQIKIVWKRICLIKEKGKNWNSTFRQLKKLKRGVFKSFYSMFYLFILWKSVLVAVSVFYVLQNVKDVIFVGTNSFLIKVQNSDLKSRMPRYLIFKRKIKFAYSKETSQIEIFHQVCFHAQNPFVWKSSVHIFSWTQR